MPFFKKCESCHHKRFYIGKRNYYIKELGNLPITSKGNLCGTCFKGIKRLVKK